jgi:predicted RNA-binding Zn-ribbon protein involved in translation (DUF1610 family)
MTRENVYKPIRQVQHSNLERASEDSPYRSWCPECGKGILMVGRDNDTLKLQKIDHCTHCGQLFFYEDPDIAGEPFEPFPTTLDKALVALDGFLSPLARDDITKSPKSAEDVALDLHHSLGQHLRNTWRLWHGSPLALHMKDVHGVQHPDDMSHAILVAYCRKNVRTAWDHILQDD